MKIIKTGIAGLDEFLQGGLTPGVVLLFGPPESGNEIFARQVAYSRSGQSKVTYFTVIKNPESVKEEMAAFGWDTSKPEKDGNWKFISLTQEKSQITAVTQEVKEHRCVVLDSLSEMLLTHKTEEVIKLLNTMSTQNREYNELHLVLLTQGMQDQKIETATQHFADGVIQFTTSWETENSSRNIIIKKIKGVVGPTRRLPYSIRKNGFTIETATRIT